MKRTVAVLVAVLAAAWTGPRRAYPHNPTTTTVLFNREVATLLQRKCLSCHAEGKLAMPLVTFANARPWAQAMKEEVLARRMPPWPADRGHGSFSNDVGLTLPGVRVSALLDRRRCAGGCRRAASIRGSQRALDARDAGPRPDAARGRHDTTRQPSRVHTVRDRHGTRAGCPGARVRLLRPGDARVARAAFFSVAGTDQLLGGWTPWHSSTQLPDGVAFRIPARARIAVDVLYSGAAVSVTDTPQLGLYTSSPSSTPAGVVTTSLLRSSVNGGPLLSAQRVTAELRVPTSRSLVSMRPEMPPGGRSLEVRLVRPDGSREVLLLVRHESEVSVTWDL